MILHHNFVTGVSIRFKNLVTKFSGKRCVFKATIGKNSCRIIINVIIYLIIINLMIFSMRPTPLEDPPERWGSSYCAFLYPGS